MKVRRVLLTAGLVLALATASGAQEPDSRLQLHGFGGWAYGNTNVNTYLAGAPPGNYGRGSFALNLAAHINPSLSVIGQTFWAQDEDATETEIDYAFAEWRFSDELRVRAGKVKQPFGIYTEVFDVGTVRPFLDLPQSIYGPIGIVAEGYQGIGVRGARRIGNQWSLSYDIYGGGIKLGAHEIPIMVARGDSLSAEDKEEESESTIDMAGARLVLSLPVRGLSIGGSAYSGRHEHEDERVQQASVGAQAEYQSDRLWLRGEYVHSIEGEEYELDASYLEGGFFVTNQWQLTGLYDWTETTVDDTISPAAQSLLEHEELAVGLNFWVAPEFVLKTSYHSIRGNRLAGPPEDDLAESVTSGELDDRTRLFQFGAQFSF